MSSTLESSSSSGSSPEKPEEILSPPKLAMSEISHSMFGAIVESGFGPEARVVDLKSILNKEPLPRCPIGNGLYLETTELTGMYGRFTSGFSHTLRYGKLGNINENFFTVQIIGRVSHDNGASKKFSFNIYANGKCRFSSGYMGSDVDPQPGAIRRFVIDAYTNKDAFFYNEIKLTNASSQFKFNGHVTCMDSLDLACAGGKHGVVSVVYEPELKPNARLELREGVKISLLKDGSVQILGADDASRFTEAYTITKQFLHSVDLDNQITVTGTFTKKSKKKTLEGGVRPSPKKQLTHEAKTLGVVNFRVGKHQATRSASCGDIREMISRNKDSLDKEIAMCERFMETSDFDEGNF
jgi:hypothetical protein